MQHLDLQVVRQALQWSCNGQRVWLCTVLATYGSAPRAPGSLLAVNASGQWLGSLSGGCVEDDFLERVALGEFPEPVAIVRYGDGSDPRSRVRLPCGGVLEVLVENLPVECEVQAHLRELERALLGQRRPRERTGTLAQRLQQPHIFTQLAEPRAFARHGKQQRRQPAAAEQALGQGQETGKIPGCAHGASGRTGYPQLLWITL